MIRATTGGVMRTYRSNLMGSFIGMNAARNTVLSQRNFNSYAEDPAAAARAFRLRKSRMTVKSQYDICTDTMGKYQQAVSCLQAIDDVLCTKGGVYGEYMNTLTGTMLSALNDPTGDARTQLMQALDQMSQSIVQTMNQKYGDNFIFAGADGHNVPFEIRDDGKLYYRGVWVDATEPNVLKNGEKLVAVNENGEVITDSTYAGPVFYLKMDNVEFITPEDYEDLYNNVPNVEMYDNGDAGSPVWYDKNGNRLGIDEDTKDTVIYDDEGNEIGKIDDFDISLDGYYRLVDENGDPLPLDTEEDLKTNLVPAAEYDAAVERANNPPQKLTDTDGNVVWVDENYNIVPEGDAGAKYIMIVHGEPETIEKADYDAQKLEADKLKYLANEKYFVDIGLGFQEDDEGKLIPSSGFNAALNGINFLGYGLDEDGDPRNLYSLVQKMKEIASSVDSGVDWSDETYDEFYHLVQKFEDGVSNYQTEYVNLDASTAKLKHQEELLSDNFYTLQEQYSDLEDVDMVDAITSFIWAEYCYNAALKVGNSILSESLMDYLR